MKRCNDSYKPSPFQQCAEATCLVGDADHYDESAFGVGVWAIEHVLLNKSSGCVKSWSEKHSSPYLDCPASIAPYPEWNAHPPAGKPLRTQTCAYDNIRLCRCRS